MLNKYSTVIIKKSQQGISLIEMMVSMGLGVVILGGLLSMYLSSSESDKTRTELSHIDASATIALRSLRKTIQHAGYGSVSVEALQKAFFTESDGSFDTSTNNPDCRDGRKLIISGTAGEGGNSGLLNPPSELEGFTKDNDEGDVITVIYRPDSPTKGYLYADCSTSIGNGTTDYPNNYPYGTSSSTKENDDARLVACSSDTTASGANGMPEAKDAKVYSSFFLRQLTGQPKQLVCYGSRSSDAEPYVIADNIDNMQIRYGIRFNNTTIYQTAAQIDDNDTDDLRWESVISVQIGLLVSSNDDVLEISTTRTYDLLGESIIKTDQKMYKVYNTTVYLHNLGLK